MRFHSLLPLLFAAACARSPQAIDTGVATVTTTTTTTSSSGSASSSTSTSVSAAAALDPVGSYRYETEINGQAVGGVLTIRSENGVLRGTIVAEGQGEFPVRDVTVSGSTMTFVFETPNGAGVGRIAFTGPDFVGSWELAGQTGPLKGKRM
jgi:hypothetical protein